MENHDRPISRESFDDGVPKILVATGAGEIQIRADFGHKILAGARTQEALLRIAYEKDNLLTAPRLLP